MDHLIIDAKRAFQEFERRVDAEYPAYVRAEIPKMIEQVWYCLLHPGMTGSALMDYGCRLRDQHHPFAPAVFSFGVLLQEALKEFEMYNPGFPLSRYHFTRRHGPYCILVSYTPHTEVENVSGIYLTATDCVLSQGLVWKTIS